MKLTLFLVFLTSFVHAAFNDFECELRTYDQKNVEINVESQFGSGMRTVRMLVSSDNGVDTFNYYVTSRYNRGFNEIEYFGGGMRLEIDLWPDTAPRWGRSYRAEFSSMDLDSNSRYSNILCRYTRI